jgi:hypothetical protein
MIDQFPGQLSGDPALQNVLEKSVRALGTIRLIDSIAGVFGLMAWNSREFLRRFRTTNAIAWPRFLIVCGQS